MNSKLLLKVKEAILAEPDNFDMDQWHCGTSHCICGWAQVLSGKVKDSFNTDSHTEVGMKLLGLTDVTQAMTLFYTSCWPQPFRQSYLNIFKDDPDLKKQQAEVAARRIDHFIATGE